LPLQGDLPPSQRLPALPTSAVSIPKSMTILALKKYIFQKLNGQVETEQDVRIYCKASFTNNDAHDMISLHITDGKIMYYSRNIN
jgi:hypothetical protein